MASDVRENPLVEGLERLPVHPTTLVIFGATGDLAKRKLLPALYNLAHEGALPERFHLIGASRSEMSDDDFRASARDSIKQFSRREPDDKVLDALLSSVRYVSGTFDDDSAYGKIDEITKQDDEDAALPCNRCYYLSTAPEFFPVIVGKLGEHGLNKHPDAEVRVIIEKPFGTTLESARELNRIVLGEFRESQVFRIDHYLGKETVQNILAFRFANWMFEPVWNRNYIDNVQITAAEDIGVGTRAGYYDKSGALRDLIQNHMMQLLALICMEPPVNFTADKLRDEKVKVLEAIEKPTVEDVPADSNTETYVALRLFVDNWRWAGVPFYLRTGKRLARKVTEIAVRLKPVPHVGFTSEGSVGIVPNQLVLTVQPNEGVSLQIGAKIPGTRMRIRPVNMEFLYGTAFLSQSPEAYERLIMDAMRGDASLFTRNDEVDQMWQIVDPILERWDADGGPVPKYAAGSQGPDEAEKLLLPGQKWRAI